MKKGPNIHIGPPVWGSDFFNRSKIIHQCWKTLEDSSLILSAPRRYGKSSIMLHLRNNPTEEFYPLYFELEDHFTLNGFMVEFISKIVDNDKSLLKKLKNIFSKPFNNIEGIALWELKIKLKKALEQENREEAWKERINRLLIELVKNKKPQKLLFIFDEFPLMLHNFIKEGEEVQKDAIKLLQWLRKLRHESPFMEILRFIFGGSIGIDKVVSYLKATHTINDVARINIGPFEPQAADDFIKRIFEANEIKLNNKVMQKITEVVGTMIPIYLQILIDSIIKESRNTDRPITPELVDECYEKRVHGPEYKHYFEDYYERLWRYYTPEDSKCARRMLRELARAEDGITCDLLFAIYMEEMGNKGDKEKFELLLANLESDFYIERSPAGDRVYFHNNWLKDWWRKYHGI